MDCEWVLKVMQLIVCVMDEIIMDLGWLFTYFGVICIGLGAYWYV